MNIIHSSSLAYQPAGYIKSDSATLRQRSADDATIDGINGNEHSQSTTQVSTPEQIRNALKQAGLTGKSDQDQPADARTAKALAAYSQTRNQSLQAQLSDIISRIDFYA